jgi:uncharacterized protein YbaP (TraB family)
VIGPFKSIEKMDPQEYKMPLLFKITKDNKSSYLYGTFHVTDSEVCKFSLQAKQAFEAASQPPLSAKMSPQVDFYL